MILCLASLLSALLFPLLLLLCTVAGERHWLFAVALFLPVHLWLLVPLALGVVSLATRRLRMVVVNAAHLLAVLLIGTSARWHFSKTAGGNPRVVCVTNNVSQNNRTSPILFIQASAPDIIALQEAPVQAAMWRRAFPSFSVVQKGQFILVTRLPIRSASLLAEPSWHHTPVAAEFELDCGGQPLVVYNVHLPTPRPAFAKLRGVGWLRELLGRNRRRSDGESCGETMTARVEVARLLAARFAAEQRPFIVLGDFNMPDRGYIYRLFGNELADAFSKTGRGFGWTFPGSTANPLTLFGPWLRLDYIFAGRGWRPVSCTVEPSRRTQHRAVVAVLEPG